MHEVGIIQSTLELAEQSARTSGATQIHRLRLRVGCMTGVVREALEFAFEVRAEVADPTVIGQTPNGTRRIVNILGGTFEGPKLKGKLLPGGADWQIIREDGFTEVDARYTLQTDTGHLIYVSNVGMRHAPPDVMKRLNAGETVDQS